jgi:hypothetical protein
MTLMEKRLFAAYSKERRMKFANATNLDRKSGVAWWRDLRFALMEKRNPKTICPRGIRLNPKVEPQVPPLRYAPVGMTDFRAVAYLGIGGGGWTESKKLIWTRLAQSSPGRSPGFSSPIPQAAAHPGEASFSRPLRQAQGRLSGTSILNLRFSRRPESPAVAHHHTTTPVHQAVWRQEDNPSSR